MFDVLNEDVIHFDTHGVDGTAAIGFSFIFIAYFLHPAVESAYKRVRAYRAWGAIEKRQAVEVTNYSMLQEILGGRGKWDTARIITILLAAFSLVSWGLELTMDLTYHKGDADMLNRSPPISRKLASDGTSTWKVMPEEQFDFEKKWKSLSNVGEQSAMSKYIISNTTTCRNGFAEGSIVVASWSNTTESATSTQLHYLRGSGNTTTVSSLRCAGNTRPNHVNITNGNVHWGSGVECESGPALNDSNKPGTPPTLILNKTNGEVYLIVEESSNYPSFVYSVWTASTNDGDAIELEYKFYMAATVRLAEAVVTGIVHGKTSGKYCFELVRIYSERGGQSDGDVTRAEPFGEQSPNDSVKIEALERIECGLVVDQKAALFFGCLVVLTTVGIAWSLCLRSSIRMDVYDRDELIRAVSMPGMVVTSRAAASTMRIFVRNEDTGSMSVVISETGNSEGGCTRIFGLGGKVVEDHNPAPLAATNTINQYNQGYGGAVVPVGPRAVWLQGVRTGMGRTFPGPRGNFRYPTSNVELSASPVPSNACSLVATPLHSPSTMAFVQQWRGPGLPRGGPGLTGGRGPSVLFDNVCSSSDSGEHERDGMQTGDGNDIGGGGTPTASIVAPGGQGSTLAMPQGVHPLAIMGRG